MIWLSLRVGVMIKDEIDDNHRSTVASLLPAGSLRLPADAREIDTVTITMLVGQKRAQISTTGRIHANDAAIRRAVVDLHIRCDDLCGAEAGPAVLRGVGHPVLEGPINGCLEDRYSTDDVIEDSHCLRIHLQYRWSDEMQVNQRTLIHKGGTKD